jgi:lipoic acid synthetase
MILGGECTRNCRFCAVPHCGNPPPPDPEEPAKVAEAAARMNLKYVVVTSVTRDDLPDGGAGQFAAVICELRRKLPDASTEVLTPDYLDEPLKTVLAESPAVFNHNIETVERLSREIRSRANYTRSLKVLESAAELSGGNTAVKSGLMVGLGETDEEVEKTICDIYNAGASILTIGQYLPPSGAHWPLDRYVEPAKFAEWKEYALKLGFANVASGPLVRSSYHADELSCGC